MRTAAALAFLLLAPLSAGCFSGLTSAPPSDSEIKARIEARLQALQGVDVSHIDLDVHARIVTVSGVVRTWDDKLEVERLVRRTRGVKQALVNLVIRD